MPAEAKATGTSSDPIPQRGSIPALPEEDPPRFTRADFLSLGRKDFQDLVESFELLGFPELPTDPIPLEPLGYGLVLRALTVPDIVGIEIIGCGSFGILSPIIARGVPYGEAAVYADIDDDARHGRSLRVEGPGAFLGPEHRQDGIGGTGLAFNPILDLSLDSRLREDHRPRPSPRQDPPGKVEDKAFTEPVVARDDVEAFGEVQAQSAGGTDPTSLYIIEHEVALPDSTIP